MPKTKSLSIYSSIDTLINQERLRTKSNFREVRDKLKTPSNFKDDSSNSKDIKIDCEEAYNEDNGSKDLTMMVKKSTSRSYGKFEGDIILIQPKKNSLEIKNDMKQTTAVQTKSSLEHSKIEEAVL